MSSQSGNDRTQNDILFNATLEAVLTMLQRELDEGATLDEVRQIVAGLLYYTAGKKTQ